MTSKSFDEFVKSFKLTNELADAPPPDQAVITTYVEQRSSLDKAECSTIALLIQHNEEWRDLFHQINDAFIRSHKED